MATVTRPNLTRLAALRIPQSAFLARRGLWLGPVAWLVAVGALALVPAEPGRTLALGGLAGAGALAVLAWGRTRWVRALAPAEAGPLVVWDRGRLARLGGIALAGGLVLGADLQFIAQPDEPFGLAGWLWLASMGLLIATTVTWPRRPGAADQPATIRPALPVRLVGSGAVRPAAVRPALPVRRVGGGVARTATVAPTVPAPDGWLAAPPAWVRWEGAALAGLVLLAGGLRLWDLQHIPFAIHRDEILTGHNALSSFLAPQSVSIFRTVWDLIDLPALWFLGVAASLKAGGLWLAWLRLPAALFGTALVLPFYGLVRSVWGRAAALAGTAVLALSAVDIHYSRVTINNIVTPFFWTVCFFFLLRGLRTRRPVNWVLAGIAGGLSEYGYYGTHLLPFLLLAFGAYLLIVHRRQGWRTLGHFGLLALGYLAAFGPLLAYFLHFRPDIYFGRGATPGVLMWNHIPRDLPDLALMWNTLWPLMADNLLGFTARGSEDLVYTGPLLLVGECALLALGTALLLWRWRHPAAFLLLISGLGTLFVGGTLIHGTPFIAHWTPAFPAFYAAIAIPLGAWLGKWRGLSPRWRLVGPALLAVVLVVDGLLNVDFYFFRYHVASPELEVRAVQSRWQADLGPDYRVFTFGPSEQEYEPETNSFLVHGQEGKSLRNVAQELPLPPEPGKGIAFLFRWDTMSYRDLVARLYPGGTWGKLYAHTGFNLYETYVLTPDQVPTIAPGTQ